MSDLVFQALTERAMPIAPQTMETLLLGLCRFQIEVADLARELAPARTLEAARYEQACAMAALDTVRTAILCRDRDIARAPLRQVASRLGVQLDEADADWPRLAMRALQVLLEAGEENLRRDQGQFQGEPRYLGAALSRAPRPVISGLGDMTSSAAVQMQSMAPPSFPRQMQAAEVHASPANKTAGAQALQTPARDAFRSGQESTDADSPAPAPEISAGALPAPKVADRPLAQAVEPNPVGETDCPTIMAGSEEYIALRSQGYKSFKKQEQENAKAGQSWAKNSAHNVRSTARLMSRIHGDRRFDTLTDQEIRESWELIVRLPKSVCRQSISEIARSFVARVPVLFPFEVMRQRSDGLSGVS